MEIIAKSLNDLPKVAEKLYAAIGDKKVWLLQGDMAAGKTTFTKSLCDYLGVQDSVSSPTFSLVNHYISEKGKNIYHFDFYRLDEPEEALDIGFYDYIENGDLSIIEWPEKLGPYLPEEAITIEVRVNEHQERVFMI